MESLETDANGRLSQVWTPGEKLNLFVTKAGYATVETDSSRRPTTKR